MPERLAHISAWLQRSLKGRPFSLTPASGDASFRRYFRVAVGDASYVVMDAPPEREDCRPYARMTERLREAGVNVPAIIDCDLDSGVVLLEDLGTRHYLDALHEDNADELYGDAMAALVRIQRDVPMAGIPDYGDALLRQELTLFPDWFLSRHLGLELDAPQQAVFQRAFDFLIGSALEQTQVFVHRDYHSRNLMVRCVANPGILDFQDAVRGPVTYDLVSLLRDVYITWPAERVAAWVAAYREMAVDQGVLADPGPDRWQRWFDLMGVQRHLKVAGIFARLFHRDGKSGYLPDIPLTLEYLRAQCCRYQELAELDGLLRALQVNSRLAARNAQVSCAEAVEP